jgi:hypothetical protein
MAIPFILGLIVGILSIKVPKEKDSRRRSGVTYLGFYSFENIHIVIAIGIDKARRRFPTMRC